MEEEASLQVKSLQAKLNDKSKFDTSSQHNKKKKTNIKKVEELKKRRPCNYCHEIGHWYRECKKRFADSKSNEKKSDEKKKTDEASGSAYTSDISTFFSETTDDDGSVWLADSGASIHMTFRCDFFRELRPVETVRFVKVVGDRIFPTADVGIIDIQASINNNPVDRQLTNVLLVPDLKRNLFSLGAITDKKFSFHSYRDRCEVRDSNGALSLEGGSSWLPFPCSLLSR